MKAGNGGKVFQIYLLGNHFVHKLEEEFLSSDGLHYWDLMALNLSGMPILFLIFITFHYLLSFLALASGILASSIWWQSIQSSLWASPFPYLGLPILYVTCIVF